MKKKILSIAVVAAVAVAAAWGFNQSEKKVILSNLALDNMEVLAHGELSSGYSYQYVNHFISVGSDGSPLHSYSCAGSGGRYCGY